MNAITLLNYERTRFVIAKVSKPQSVIARRGAFAEGDKTILSIALSDKHEAIQLEMHNKAI